ncbi:YcjF family protein [Colwellia sp. Bg11-28]|uniref:YcjF family protein n=1 Tax=Colwellia sp. Bg11-28 TaxID=2058305 RepID=UPI000C329DA2|nr:YcjF family protein [Colwellia sp. Bg11-28]PKH86626.1 TIGR01620 family protein [Colwellia sp. Bg11-28]
MTTKDNENLQQQQILFSESDSVTEQSKGQFKDGEAGATFTEQVVFDNDTYLPMSLDENGLDEVRKTELDDEQLHQDIDVVQGGKRSWLWRTIGTLFVILLAIEAVDFFIVGFEQSPIITSLYALLLASLTLVSTNYLWREFIGLKQFKNRQKMKQQATELLLIDSEQLTEHSNKRGKDFCENISNNLPCDLVFDCPKEQQVWHDALAADYSSSELVQLYSRVVLSKVDEKALNEVAKFSTEAVVLIALSPVALIDMLIMLSRNLRMINKIAGLYGLKLGYWSRIKLIKQVFVNMAYAGASELVADFGSDMLGAELLGKLSARFAQGLGAGMLTARLGAKTMELCRPIPFKEKPKLTQVRKKIAQQIKALVSPSKK